MPDINISLESAVEVGYQLNAMQVLSVDLDTTAILRQIIEIDTIDEIIQLKTIDADLEDVFRDADFELDSEFNPNISLKSGVTDEEISRALSDGIKVYPARVIYHTDDGVYVESVFEDEQLKGATMISGEYSKNISFSHRIKNHNLYNYESGNIKAKISIDDATVSLGSKFVLATSIRKRKLRAFRFEVRPSASTSARFGAHVTGKFTKSEVKKIKSKVLSKTYIYYLGGILALSVKVDVDLYAAYNLNCNARFDATTGFYSTVGARLGARWTKKGWTPIRSFHSSRGIYPLSYTAGATSDLRLELFPRATAYICGVNGVSMDVVPYLDNHIGVSSTNGVQHYNAHMRFGLDTRINARVKIAKKSLASYSSGNIRIISPVTLWSQSK